MLLSGPEYSFVYYTAKEYGEQVYIENMNTIKHVLPGETGGDATWFYRQNSFEQKVILQQVEWKRTRWPEVVNGRDTNNPAHTYPHILPAGCEFLSICEAIAFEVFNYCSENDIEIHSGIRNLKSSQAACFNILFPLKLNLDAATKVLGRFFPKLESVDNIEFEYTGPPEITEWLGEPPHGKRGKNRTSIDVAMFWTDKLERTHISLIEWKYSERSFGSCSMHGKSGNGAVCDEIDVRSGINPGDICPLSVSGNDNPRRYWEHLRLAGIYLERYPLRGCPFSTPLYQIMRQFEVAAYLRNNRCADNIEVVLMAFRENKALQEIPRGIITDCPDILSFWNSLLSGAPQIRQIFIEDMILEIEGAKVGAAGWWGYLNERYSFK